MAQFKGNSNSQFEPSLLLDFSFFQDIPPSAVHEIVDAASMVRVAQENTIFRQTEPANKFFFLLDGHVRVVRLNEDGRQVIVRYISPGEVFGIAPAIGMNSYPATAIAAVECAALSWPTKAWPDLSSRFPALASGVHKTVGKRLGEVHERMMDLVAEHVEKRIARVVLSLLNQAGRESETGIVIDIPISRQDIAEMTGTTPHTVSRIMKSWAVDGIIKSGRRKVTVLHRGRLETISKSQ